MRHAIRYAVLACLPLLLTACPSLVVSGAAEVVETSMENRSAGRKIDDKILYADVYNQFTRADRADLIRQVNLNTRFARVMLTGTVKSEEDARTANELAWKATNVEEVINELAVNPNRSAYDIANDSLVKRNLEARLLITKDVWVINYSLDIQNGVAYIIGRVHDQAELNRVLGVCRTTRGVKRVVSHLQINPETDLSQKAPGITQSSRMPASAGGMDKVDATDTYTPAKGPIKSAPVPQDSTRPASGGY